MQTTLNDLKNAVKGLPKSDYGKFRKWFFDNDWAEWDEQIEKDSIAGKFDSLIENAKAEKTAGKLKVL